MRLDQLSLTNFRCYQNKSFNFHPQVNLIVGQNATGKTALLDAIAIATATWLLGFKKKLDNKGIATSDATLIYSNHSQAANYAEQWPVKVSATGQVNNTQVSWERSKESQKGNTRYGLANDIIDIAKTKDAALTQHTDLPLISYYGTMRLWQDPKVAKTKAGLQTTSKPSRLDGYKHSVDPRIAVKELVKWFAKQEWLSFQQGQEPALLTLVRNAILNSIDGATNLRYDPNREELLLTTEKQDPQPFSILSDGQRNLLALIADIAQKAATLNPHLGENALQQTHGIVLIDELDLHLHPRWQRSVVENLRTTFPNIQFICTTHSPFLIQSLRSSEEIIMLDGLPSAQISNKSLDDIAIGIMAVNEQKTSDRYHAMKITATEFNPNHYPQPHQQSL